MPFFSSFRRLVSDCWDEIVSGSRSQFWESTLWVIASGACFKNVQHPLPWLHVTLIGGRPGAPPYRQVFRRLGEGRSRFTCPVCRGYLNPATPEATYTHKKILVSVRKTNVFSNMRSDFFNKHPEVIHQTQVTLMGKTTFLHKQFIKNGERISKSINNSRARRYGYWGDHGRSALMDEYSGTRINRALLYEVKNTYFVEKLFEHMT